MGTAQYLLARALKISWGLGVFLLRMCGHLPNPKAMPVLGAESWKWRSGRRKLADVARKKLSALALIEI